MRRWAIVSLIVVAVIIVIFGGAVQLITTLLPQDTQANYLVYLVGFGITYAIVNGLVTVLQLFGKSPWDFLPEKSLRQSDPQRYKLTKHGDFEFLYKKAREAEDNKEYEWAIAFAEAAVLVKPSDHRAYRLLGDALLEMNRPAETLKYGKLLVEKFPLGHEGYQLLGNAYRAMGDLASARTALEQALERVIPLFKQFVLLDLAEVYEALALPQEAAETYRLYLNELTDPPKKYHVEKLEQLRQLSSTLSTQSE